MTSLIFIQTPSAQATQGIPYRVNFQGRLADNNGNILPDGLYNIKFTIYDASSSGTNLWEEDRVITGVDNRVQVTNGLFSVQFGSLTALNPSVFNSSSLRYLEIELPSTATKTCATNGCASFTEGPFTPRHPMGASPYAYVADTLDGLDSAAFSQLTAANTYTGANLFAPTAAATVALTVKATTAGSTNGLEVFDSGGARQAYFDANGKLNVAQTIQATSNNAIDLGTTGSTFRSGFFGTSVQSPSFTGAGAVTLSSGGSGDLTLDSASNVMIIAASDTTLRRTAAGTYTLDLADGSNTTLAVTNSGSGAANLSTDGTLTVGTFAAATSVPVCSNSGTLSTCNSNPSSVTLQQAYAAGATISTSGNDVAFTLNSTQGFSVTTATNTTGFTSFLRADGAGSSDPAQLVLVKNNDTDRVQPIGIKIDAANTNGKITTALDASSANIVTALAIGGNAISGTNFSVNSSGVITAPTATNTINGAVINSGALSSLTGVTLASGNITTPGNISTSSTGTISSATTLAAGSFAAATSVPVCSNSGTLSTCNANPSGVTLQQAYASGPTISTSGNDIGFTLNSSQNFTVNTVAAGTGFTTFSLADGSNATPPAQLVLINYADVNQVLASGLKITAATGGGITSGIDVSDADLINAVSVGDNTILGTTAVIDFTNFDVLSTGAVTAVGVNSGAGLLQGALGLTVTGAAVNLNASSSFAINIGTGSNNQQISIGGGSATLALDTSNIDISTAGAVTGATGITMASGNFLQTGSGNFDTGTGTVGLNGATTVANNKAFIAGGTALFKDATDAASAFEIQNSNSNRVLSATTTETNLITNPSFEPGTIGWAPTGTGAAVAQNSTAADSFSLISSLQVTSGATANGGAQVSTFTAAVTPTTYTLSFYAKANTLANSFADLAVSITGGTTPACTLNSNTVNTSGFQRYYCTFTSTTSNITAINIGESGTTSHVFFLDGVQLESTTSATGYGIGSLLFGGTVNSPLIVTPASNSANALQVQNCFGSSVFNIDTTDTNLIVNPGFEAGITGGSGTGWSVNGGSTAISRDTTQAYIGSASLKVVISSGAVGGAQWNLNPITTAAGTTYSVSFYAELGSGTAPTFQITYSPDNSVTNTCNPTGTAVTTGWTRFSCTVTHATTPTTSGYIRIAQTNSAISTWYIDSVQMESGTTATAYGAGSIAFNGVFTSPVNIKNTSDSTTAFQVQNAASSAMFGVDTLNKTVIVGSSTSDATQVLLQLDTFSTLADTATCSATVNQGALYYDAAASAAAQAGSSAIRSCVNGAWEDVVTTAGLGIMLYGVVADSGTEPGDLASLQTTPGAAIGGPCKVSWVANAATSTVRIQACIAYSGGRKVSIQQNTTFSVPTNAASGFSHICLSSTGAISATASNATETANLPAVSITAPVLCLADVKATAGAAGIANIYDTRAFTTSIKEFVTTSGAIANGVAVVASGTGIALPSGAGATMRGITVAGSTAAAANGVTNAIIVTAGPVVVKATAATNAAVVTASGTNGYVSTGGAVTNTYSALGQSRNAYPATACITTANAANCNNSIFFSLNIR